MAIKKGDAVDEPEALIRSRQTLYPAQVCNSMVPRSRGSLRYVTGQGVYPALRLVLYDASVCLDGARPCWNGFTLNIPYPICLQLQIYLSQCRHCCKPYRVSVFSRGTD